MSIATVETIITTILASTGLHTDAVVITHERAPVLGTPYISVECPDVPQPARESFYSALRHLTREIYEHTTSLPFYETGIIIDTDNELIRTIDRLTTQAKVLSSRVTAFGTEIHAEPMSPLERKIFHTVAQSLPGIHSESFGEGTDRHIVLSPKEIPAVENL
jgi:hypothetical protein